VNTLLLEPGELTGTSGRVRIAGRRREHVYAVHRAAIGDRLRVGMIGGRLGEATIVALDDARLDLDVELDREPPPPLPLVLVLAMPRPKVMRRVLQAIAAFGVERVVLLGAWRVERSSWESPMLGAASIRAQLVLGLEQSGDTRLPEVMLRRRFKPFVEDELDELARATRRLVAHPDATVRCPCDVRTAFTLAVGPEGGFTEYEIGMLVARGFEAVSLGPRVLRVEQAVPALLGRLALG